MTSVTEIPMPRLGETVSEGTIIGWCKRIGDSIDIDDVLFEVSTDKVDTEVPSPVSGILTEIRVAAGETVPVGVIVAVVSARPAVAADSAAVGAAFAPRRSEGVPPRPPSSSSVPPSPSTSVVAHEGLVPVALGQPRTVDSGRRAIPRSDPMASRLSPVVRRLIHEHRLEIGGLQGTGPAGRVTRKDVQRRVAERAAPLPSVSPANREGSVQFLDVSVIEVDLNPVEVVIAAFGHAFELSEGFSLTTAPFIVRALVDALAAHPQLHGVPAGLSRRRPVHLCVISRGVDGARRWSCIDDADGKRLRALARALAAFSDPSLSTTGPANGCDGSGFRLCLAHGGGGILQLPGATAAGTPLLSVGSAIRRAVVVEDPFGNESISIRTVSSLALAHPPGLDPSPFLAELGQILALRAWAAEL